MSYFNLFLLLLIAVILREPVSAPFYTIELQDQPSGISTPEDPQARANYEIALLVDPSTGEIPHDIRQKELRFSRTIPTRQSYYKSRKIRKSERNYELAGPFNVGGRTREMALDIRNEKVIIAGGISGGIWKTTNGGTTWYRTSDPSNRNSVSSLAQDIRTEKEDTWYYGTGELVGNSAKSLAAPYRGDGIYKSTDGGESWVALESTSKASPDKFTSQFQYIWGIETNHMNLSEDEVLVAAYGGILRSLDGGNSWEVKLGQELLDPGHDSDLNESNASFYTSIRKTSKGYFFATLSSATSSGKFSKDGGFYFSMDGNDFIDITPPDLPGYHERTVIGISGDEKQVYFLTEEGDEAQVSFRRMDIESVTDGTITHRWTNLSHNIPKFGGDFGDYDTQIGYNMVVEVHPQNPGVIYMGGTNLYRSTDGFTSERNTKWIGGYSPVGTGAVYPGHYPDQHFLVFFPSNPKRMLSANDGGIRITTDNLADSVKWTSLNNGYITSQFYTTAQQSDKATPLILGGMQDTGSHLKSVTGENAAWTRILGGDGGYCAITPNQSYFYVSFQESQIYRLTLTESSRELTSYARVDPLGVGEDKNQPYLFINPFILDPLNHNRMFLTGGNELWKNTNLSQIPSGSQNKTKVNWTRIPDTQIASGVYTALEKARDQDILYAGTFKERPTIYAIENASTNTEQVVSIKSPLFPSRGHIICIAVNPEDAGHFVVVFSNYNVSSLFMTTDGGDTFEDISGNLEEFPDGTGNGPSVRWAEIIPKMNGYEYFVGTSVGLYSSSDIQGNNTFWVKESEDDIGHSVVSMLDYRAVDGRLVIATHGNGTYEVLLEETRPFKNQLEPEKDIILTQNYPNPFDDQTLIEFSIPEDDEVRIDLYDNTGRLIRHLLWGPQFKGTSHITWDGTNTAGVPVKPGVYHYVFKYRNTQLSKRLIYKP